MKRVFVLSKVSLLTLIVAMMFSCNNGVKKVNIDNQMALSLFSGTIKVGDLLNGKENLMSSFLKVSEDGSLNAYYADSINDIVVAKNILSGIEDVTFDVGNTFDLPEIPASPVPIQEEIMELPFENFLSIPFEYDGYEINHVEIGNGTMVLNLQTDFDLVKKLVLTTDNIISADGENFELQVDLSEGQKQEVIDLNNCIIEPKDKKIEFSVTISVVLTDQGLGGKHDLNLEGGMYDIEFKAIDGAIKDFEFDFNGTQDFNFSLPDMYGDLKIMSPKFNIKYLNSFGFTANCTIDSLYFTDINEDKTSLIKDWQAAPLVLKSTSGEYDMVDGLSEMFVDELDILKGYSHMNFDGKIHLGCESMTENMITEDSRISLIAEMSIPLEFKIDNLSYFNVFDFNVSLNEGSDKSDEYEESNTANTISLDNIFDELEFKFVFENAIPIQIMPQVYVMEQGVAIDSLFDKKPCVSANFDGEPSQDVFTLLVTGDKIYNLMRADQLLLDVGLSSLGNVVVINANDFFNLRIGVKTKTSEIDIDALNS